MAAYRVRWVDPLSGLPKVRVFASRARAVAFRDAPRLDPVEVELQRLSEVNP